MHGTHFKKEVGNCIFALFQTKSFECMANFNQKFINFHLLYASISKHVKSSQKPKSDLEVVMASIVLFSDSEPISFPSLSRTRCSLPLAPYHPPICASESSSCLLLYSILCLIVNSSRSTLRSQM